LKIITFAMALAPFAVALLVFPVATEIGLRILETLGKFMVVVILGLAFHMFVVYSIVLSVFVKMNPFVFFKKIREVMLTAFATSSSNATLPVSLKVGEENLKIPKEINRFVLTVGATANQNGTALYEGVTILFLAQVFGANLSIENQLMVILMTILAGIGTAGVPGGSLPYIAMILTMVGIPGERIALILGVDRILDMCRTVLNVTGDLVVAAYVASSEGKLVVEET
jgi:DAACS family dicarboxylate/amino acid:cation (Na+ or H+) symporter